MGHELPAGDADSLELVRRRGRLGFAGAVPRDVRPHRRGDADRRGPQPGRPRVRRGPGRGRRRVRRDAVRARAAPRLRSRSSRWSTPSRRVRRGRGRDRPRGSIVARQLLTAMRHQARSNEIAELAVRTATAAWSASTSPAPRPATRRPGTSTRSSTCSARTRTSPSTPARPSVCRRSGRRSSGAVPTGSVTAYGSSTTSPRTARRQSGGWRRTSATGGSRWSCARAPTSRPAPPSRSPTTRSACSPNCGSGSR